MSNEDSDWSNPLVVGFGTATAEDPPFPAQQHLDATDGEVVNPAYVVAEADGTVHTVTADGTHQDDREEFGYGTRSASDEAGSKSPRKRTSKRTSSRSKASDDE